MASILQFQSSHDGIGPVFVVTLSDAGMQEPVRFDYFLDPHSITAFQPNRTPPGFVVSPNGQMLSGTDNLVAAQQTFVHPFAITMGNVAVASVLLQVTWTVSGSIDQQSIRLI